MIIRLHSYLDFSLLVYKHVRNDCLLLCLSLRAGGAQRYGTGITEAEDSLNFLYPECHIENGL